MPTRPSARPRPSQAFEAGLDSVFAEFLRDAPGPWMQSVRREAFERFKSTGVPHRRQEWWKYSDLASRLTVPLKGQPSIHAAASAERPLLKGLPAHEIQICAGRVVKYPHQNVPDSIEIIPLRDALAVPSLWLRPWLQASNSTTDNLNLAFCSDGILVRIGRGIKINQPFLLRSIETVAGVMSHARVVFLLEEGAEAAFVEICEGSTEGPALYTERKFFVLSEGAKLTHIRIATASKGKLSVREDQIDLAAKAEYLGVQLCAGGEFVRNDTTVNLNGANANFESNCAYSARADQLVDYSFTINHNAAGTRSRLLAKGLAHAQGRGVVQGKVSVVQAAQGADSHQLARGLMMEEGAEIFHRPELEIYADDVKCGHGATIGGLDETQLFYLTSRGIPEQAAKSMLLTAYFAEVSDRAAETLGDELSTWAAEYLASDEGSS